MPWRENKGVANLNGFRRILLVAYGKKYFREIAILLNRFLDRLGPQILHEDFLQDFLRSNTKHNL